MTRNLTGLVLGLIRKIAYLPRVSRRIITITADAVLCAIACYVAFAVRIGGWQLSFSQLAQLTAISLAIWLAVALPTGFYRSLIRFSGVRTILNLIAVVAIYTIPMIAIFAVIGIPDVPRTFGAIQPIFYFGLLLTARTVVQVALIEISGSGSERPIRVLIFGAGRTGQQLAQSLAHEAGFRVVGFLDDDERLAGQKIDNVRIHPTHDLAAEIGDLDADEVLLATPTMARHRRRKLVEELSARKIRVRVLPPLGQIAQGRVTVNDLKDLRIDELLGRDPVEPDHALLARPITGKTVLVTGAGGSIGSELCRQIIRCRPSQIILFEQSEPALFEIERELRLSLTGQPGEVDIIPQLGSLINSASTLRIFRRYRPDTIFHAAAYKHVPLVEANPLSGILNNVFGTFNAVMAAEDVGVTTFILVSTDKAVRPTNIMGASKRVCEQILQARAESTDSPTTYSMVRFGNVLGSSGSVVPLFKAQIAKGGPITLTHRDMTRYFMTIPEAAQLVMQAGAMARGGEVFLLDMGEPVRIQNLAETMVQLSGLTVRDHNHPDGDIAIVETGLRPGEKLYEELLIDDAAKPTPHPRILQGSEPFLAWPKLEDVLQSLKTAIESGDRVRTQEIVRKLVPEYGPQSGPSVEPTPAPAAARS